MFGKVDFEYHLFVKSVICLELKYFYSNIVELEYKEELSKFKGIFPEISI